MLKNLFANSRQRLFWLLAVSFAVKVLYVFLLTDYQHYLFSDFQGYWDRALERLHGHDVAYTQWAVWPPLPHILLSWAFRVIDILGLSHWRLEAVLVGNILLSTLSVALLYDIALRLIASSRAAFIVAAIYAFAFPLVYLNAFVMSEHPAVAALLTAVWLLIRFPTSRRCVFAGGVALAIAVGLRPAFGLIAIPCGLYVLCGSPFARLSMASAMVFSLGFLLTIASVVTEVHRISHGELNNLSANGGLNFYFAQCRTHEVVSRDAQYVYNLIPPATVQLPENGRVELSRPFHDQAFFTQLGWQCVRAQPDLWWRNFAKLRDLFFGPLLPSVDSAWGFNLALPAFRWLAVAMMLILPLGVMAVRSKRRNIAALLGGIVVVSLAMQYFFNAEHRYWYPLFGIILVLDAWIVVALYRQWPATRRVTQHYAIAMVAVGLGLAAHAYGQRSGTPTLIEASWYDATQLYGRPFDLLPPQPAGRFAVDTLRFPEDETLRHVDLGAINSLPSPLRQVAIRFSTCMTIDAPGRFEFAVASDDGFELSIDDRVIASHRANRPYAATRGGADLATGPHRYVLRYFQDQARAGVTGVWRRKRSGHDSEDEMMPAVGLRDIGQAGDGVRFLPPAQCLSAPNGAANK